MNKARGKAHSMHFNKCNREQHWEGQKTINNIGQARIIVPCPQIPCVQIGRQNPVKIIFLQLKSRGLIPLPSLQKHLHSSLLESRPTSYSSLHPRLSAWNLEGVNSRLLHQLIERSAFSLYFTLIFANSLECIWLRF